MMMMMLEDEEKASFSTKRKNKKKNYRTFLDQEDVKETITKRHSKTASQN